MKKIYLAGPDVFYPDSEARKNKLLKLCEANGFMGIYPGDNDIKPADASIIRQANIKMIRESDYVLANLSPFRGFEPDSGTVFEVGYATALGKTVMGYSSDTRPVIQRLREYQSLADTQTRDKDGLHIENFGLPNNLMFGHIVLGKTAAEVIALFKQ